jgi:hypothetical protein
MQVRRTCVHIHCRTEMRRPFWRDGCTKSCGSPPARGALKRWCFTASSIKSCAEGCSSVPQDAITIPTILVHARLWMSGLHAICRVETSHYHQQRLLRRITILQL